MAGTTAQAAPSPLTGTARLLAMAPTLLATTLFVMNQTNVVVSLPHMQGTFSATRDQIAWIITSYLVSMTIMTAAAGWFSTRFGRKRVFLLCLAGFGVSSFLCAYAPSLEVAVLLRRIQGITGGPIMPITQAIMLDSYPREKSGTALGIWGIGITIGPVLGPIIGGVLTEDYGWPWVFFFNVPVAAIAFLGVLFFVPEVRRDRSRSLDWTGFIAISVAILCVQLVLNRGQRLDWYDSTEIIVETAIAVLALYVLVVHTATAKKPFLEPRMFHDRNFVLGIVFIFCWGLSVHAPLVILSLRLQSVDALPVWFVGVLMSPRGLGGILAMTLAGRLNAVLNPKILAAFGFFLIAAAGWMMQSWSHTADLWEVGIAGFLMGVGVAQAYVSLTVMAMATVPPQIRVDAVSLYSLFLNMGSGMGIAIAIVALSQFIQISHEQLAENVTKFSDLFRDHLLPHLWDFGSQSGLMAVDRVVQIQANTLAFNRTFFLMSLNAVAVIPFLFLLTRPKKQPPKR